MNSNKHYHVPESQRQTRIPEWEHIQHLEGLNPVFAYAIKQGIPLREARKTLRENDSENAA